MSNFQHPSAKISIASIDPGYTNLEVQADYNPKELQIDKSVPWQKNPQANKSPEKGIQLEFTGAEGRSMSIEMLFDGFEDNKPVAGKIETLNKLASPLVPGSTNENERRPHRCVVTWGSNKSFRCVIESLSVKYTMFSPDGDPLRATATVKLKEADVVGMAKSDGK
ncbi:MAG TPA: hypothetical protein VHN14_35900 [Kofleriaceae bacterium]|jgi:hypothetical protein|nr:hypothetical protein [Kofleriaceae bacterium]